MSPAAPSIDAQVLPPSLERSQETVGAGEPVTFTVKLAVPPSSTDWPVGWALILGAGVVAWAALRARVVPLVVTPLSNVTGDPAVDYFASALSRQVAQDLTGTPGLDVHLLEAWSAPRGDRGKGALTLTWTVGREGRGYRITVSLADAEGRSRGDRTFMVLPEDLHRVHKVIAEYVAQQVAGEPAQAAAFRRPTLADEADAGGWATPAGGES